MANSSQTLAIFENKPYWWDEVINSVHSAGYSNLGIQLAIVNLIYHKIHFQPTALLTKKIWSFILAIFLSVGIISCSLIINSTSWWNKFLNFQNIPIAEIINSSETPLILTPKDVSSHLISISHNLSNQVTVRFVDKPDITQETKVFSDRFLLTALFT